MNAKCLAAQKSLHPFAVLEQRILWLIGQRILTQSEFEALANAHQAELYCYVRYLGAPDSASAEEVVQET